MAKMKNDTAVVTGKVRLSFVNLFKPKAFEGQEAKYSALLLIPKDDKETVEFIKKAQKNAARAKWGDKIPKNLKQTLRDGDEEMDTAERPEYAGHYFMNVSSKRKPQLFSRGTGADGKPLPLENEDELYSGCYAQVSINAFGYEVSGSKGVTFGINGCRKVADGESLGGFVDTSEDYDDFGDEDEDDIF